MKANLQVFIRGMILFLLLFICNKQMIYADNMIVPQDTEEAVKQIRTLIQDSWEEGAYYNEIVIDPDTHVVKKDNEKISFSEAFSVTNSEANQILSSADTVEAYFDDTVCDTEVTKDDQVIVTNNYQLKRIIVHTDSLKEDYGAQTVIYNQICHQYILQFDSEEDTASAYEKISTDSSYESYYLDHVISASDVLEGSTQSTSASYSWGVTAMGLDRLKEDAVKYNFSSDVTVAVLDTGVDKTNSFLKGRVDSKSYDLMNDTYAIYDIDGHGTHVAGIIADGTSSNVNLLCIKVFDDEGESSFLTLQAGIQYAINQEADVINMSLGWEDKQASSCTELDKVIALAYKAGIPICTAAGNDAENVTNCYPACNKQTIAISAVDSNNQFASSYSNYGSLIDFCAPGTNIKSIASSSVGGGTMQMSGTSMASPHIAAAIAMIQNLHPEYSVAKVYAALQKYGVDLGETGKDELYGNGLPKLTTYYYDAYQAKTDIAKVKVSGIVNKNYTGKSLKQSITVSYKGKKLTAGKDYKISYKNNKKIGTASVTLTGIGDYRGSLKKNFKITLATPKLKSLSSTYNTQKLTWKKVIGASGYYIYTKNSKGWKKIKTIKSGKTVSYTKKGLSCGKSYTYTVKAYYKNGTKTVTSAYNKSGITAKAATAAPVLKSVKKKAKGLKVNWKTVSGANGYYVYRKTKNSSKWTQIAKVSGHSVTSYYDKTVNTKKKYIYTVRSYRKVNKKIIKGSYKAGGISS